MVERWYHEAETYGVFPLASAGASRLLTPRPVIAANRHVQVWYPDAAPVYFGAGPKPYNRAYSITADVTIPDGDVGPGAEGILVSHGSRHGGYALFVENGRLVHLYNYLAQDRFEVVSDLEVPTGDVTLRYEFVPTGPVRFGEGKGPAGNAMLYFDDRLVGAAEMSHTTPNRVGPVGFSCGYAAFDTVDPTRYSIPFRFTGTIHRVTYDTSGDGLLHEHHSEAELQALMSQQ